MHATAVHEDTVKKVLVSDVGIRIHGQVLVLIEVQHLGKFEAVVHLDDRVLRKVVLESFEVQVQHGRERFEDDALFGVLQPVTLRAVLVVVLQVFRLDVLVEACVEILVPFDVKREVQESLFAVRLVVHVQALDIAHHLSPKKFVDCSLHARPLHLLLQPLAHDAIQLLHVMLLERLIGVPAERARQILGGDALLAELDLVKERLQRERDALARNIVLRCRHVVNRLAEAGDVKERLQQRVHVARRTLVLEPDEPGLLLRVVRKALVALHSNLTLHRERVIRHIPLGRVIEIGEWDELRETPVRLAAVEEMARLLLHRVMRARAARDGENERRRT
mmetsp:Transcript_18165/g.59353  ORF Transcript_18165/g.59353 Transcript_18165/m.59353 type:complete len:335 (-) Transcript_18165:347-1351(-)